MNGFNAASAAKLNVTYVPLDNLKLDPRNPRRHSRNQVGKLAKSIATFGFNVPVLVDRDHKVIAGHGRIAAAKELGLTEVPTIQVDHLTDAQARAFQIADNRLAELSTWDDDRLAEQLEDLATGELNFSLEATGFTVGEIDCRIESLGASGSGRDPADRLPPPGPAVSRLGDLWILGHHRVLCGDPLQPMDYHMLMQAEPAAMVFTTVSRMPPLIGAAGAVDEGQFTALLTQACQFLAVESAEGALHYICADWRDLRAVLAAGQSAYHTLADLCVWAKDKAEEGELYASQHELVCVFRHSTAPQRPPAQTPQPDRQRSNLWRYRDCAPTRKRTKRKSAAAIHDPTRKPVSLVADAITDSIAQDAIVLDPFLGSGATVIAAERMGRRGYGLDLDPRNIDTVVRRWQDFTGQTAIHAGTGRTFAAIEAEAEASHAA
ncbi:MAG: site-specific DNA-methyltransferase [Alphaproteobacteria bacterium]|nr:site-specific DNA-methyltransferase [Alphaproteobacteria bacterium]